MTSSTSSSSLTTFYDTLTLHYCPGPRSLSYFVSPFVLLPAALLTPPRLLSHHTQRLVVFPAILAVQMHAWHAMGGPDVLSVTVIQGGLLLLVACDPRREFRRVWVEEREEEEEDEGKGHIAGGEREEEKRDSGRDRKKMKRMVLVEQAYPDEFRERVKWTLSLLSSLRFTGWRIGEARHDAQQPFEGTRSRGQFVREVGANLLLQYLILDAVCYLAALDPYFTTPGMSVDAPFPSPFLPTPGLQSLVVVPLRELLPPRLLRSAVLAGQVYAIVWAMFLLPAILAVGLNSVRLLSDAWSPHTWPPLFGSFSAIGRRGLRGLWGSWWHQNNRQVSSVPGRALGRFLLGERADTSLVGYMITTTVAFLLSGWLHMGLIPPQPRTEGMTPNAMRLHIAGFFWAQIPGFGIELILVKTIKRLFPGAVDWPGAKVLVVCWAACWLCATLPILIEPFRELGYEKTYIVPISLFRGLNGEGWWPY